VIPETINWLLLPLIDMMPERTFDIQSAEPERYPKSDCVLTIEAGESHFALMLFSRIKNRLVGLRYYQFSPTESVDAYTAILLDEPWCREAWGRVQVFFHTRELLLLPEALYQGSGEDRMLAVVHGDLPKGVSMADQVQGNQIRNLYRVPEALTELLTRGFPQARYRHDATAVLDWLASKGTSLPETMAFIEVYPSQVTVTVNREYQVQLVQTYPYDIPEDVSYHLLNIAEQLGLEPDTVAVKVGGLIDPDSPLFTELMKYFRHLDTLPATECAELDAAFRDLPPHYFTPQILLAACA
jgi:hypothetical protein